VYDSTFEAIAPVFEEFLDWEFIILGRENESRELPQNCIRAPFIPISEILALYVSADLNLVRGENTLVTAICAGKPWLWDIYRESNGAHAGKLADCLDTLTERGTLPLDQRKLTEFIQDPASILREVLRKATPSINAKYPADWLPDLTQNMHKWIMETTDGYQKSRSQSPTILGT
jgi:hypothetical protein